MPGQLILINKLSYFLILVSILFMYRQQNNLVKCGLKFAMHADLSIFCILHDFKSMHLAHEYRSQDSGWNMLAILVKANVCVLWVLVYVVAKTVQ